MRCSALHDFIPSAASRRVLAPPPRNVCEFVRDGAWDIPDSNHHLLPISLRMIEIDPVSWLRSLPLELGLDYARLPVVHTSAGSTAAHHRHEHGMWFYYARGCSDMYYDVGTTFIAANKLHAAILLTSRVEGVSPSAAAARVASWLLADPMNESLHKGKHLSNSDYHAALAWSSRPLRAHLCTAAHGLVGPPAFTARPGWGTPCNESDYAPENIGQNQTSCLREHMLQRLLISLNVFEFLDSMILSTAKALEIDSVLLALQPSAADVNRARRGMLNRHGRGVRHLGREPLWAVEILDVRTAENRTYKVEDHAELLTPYLQGSDHQQCQPSCFFPCCAACGNAPKSIRGCIEQPKSAFRFRPSSDPTYARRCTQHCTDAELRKFSDMQLAVETNGTHGRHMRLINRTVPCCNNTDNVEKNGTWMGRCSWMAETNKCRYRAPRRICDVACKTCKLCAGHPQLQSYQTFWRGHVTRTQQPIAVLGSQQKVVIRARP